MSLPHEKQSGQSTESQLKSPFIFALRPLLLAIFLSLASVSAAAQSPLASAAAVPGASAKEKSRITPEQARQLFSLVDQLIKFSSDESGLPIESTVKRQITSRAAVESYLKEKMDDDEGAKRLQRSEIVLKKFGLLDRDFSLKPFLLALLKEQIEAYYDSKTKTVYMLDWLSVDEQKPVLAHELTHALQDQHSDLEKWNDQTPDDVSLDAAGDSDHLRKDEMDTARDAVVEGQATAVMMDYILKPLGKSLVKNPEVLGLLNARMESAGTSPTLARAPILLSESLLFPYREGLSFEQDVWMDQGQTAAFAGTLDHPPSSTWEIINPRYYEQRRTPSVPSLPNIHPLVDPLYKPYDIGQMGQLDLRILAETLGGKSMAVDLTPAWDGGIYWAGQRLSATTPAEQSTTNSIALFYLSAWKNPISAQSFARLYAQSLGRKYAGLKVARSSSYAVFPPPVSQADEFPDLNTPDSNASASNSAGSDRVADQEQLFTTAEGPVLITTRGKYVFIAESFDLDLAHKLTALVLDAQNKSGDAQSKDGETKHSQALQSSAPAVNAESLQPLTANLVDFFSNCGVMKASVDAALQAKK